MLFNLLILDRSSGAHESLPTTWRSVFLFDRKSSVFRAAIITVAPSAVWQFGKDALSGTLL